MNDKCWIRLMDTGAMLGCHQMPERSFFYKGYQFPVCARCTGVLVASVLAVILFFFRKLPWKVCVAMSGVMLADWLLQYAGIRESNNGRRFVTGLIGGFGYATLHLYFYQFLFGKLRDIFGSSPKKKV